MDSEKPLLKKTKVHEQISDESKSALKRYQDIVVCSYSKRYLLKYELINFFFSGMKGILGLGLRQKLYPGLFLTCGKKVIFGSDTLIRCPPKIKIGNKVVVSDGLLSMVEAISMLG